MIKKILITFYLIFSFSLSAQWLKNKDKFYLKLGSGYMIADEYFNPDGIKMGNATRGFFINSIFAKYGLNKNWNVIAYVPFFVRIYQNEQVSSITNKIITPSETVNHAFGDMELSIEHKLFKNNKWAMSASFSLGIPVGAAQGGSDGSFGSGDGEFNQKIRLSAGTSYKLLNTRAYFKSFWSFNQRNKGFSDEWKLGIETGAPFFDRKVFFVLRSSLLQSFQNGDISALSDSGGFFANNIEFLNVGGELIYFFSKKVGVSFSYINPIWGEIGFAVPSYAGGIFFNTD